MTGLLVLPRDVVIAPVRELSSQVRRALGQRSGFAITRLRRRSASKLLDADGARLLRSFRRPRRVVDVIARMARRNGADGELLLRSAFPLLRDCINDAYLVKADARDAAAEARPRLDRGASVGGYRVTRCVRQLEDSELYHVVDRRGRSAALKLLPARCLREQVALERLDGTVSPRLYATGTWNGLHWMALEWCPGVAPQVIAGEMRAAGDWHGLLALARAIAEAYATLHDAGIVHADVHPGNLLVTAEGRAVILDFGLAEIANPGRRLSPNQRGGVAFYAPPEHARPVLAGRRQPEATTRSDQFGVAAILYELLTGERYLDFPLRRQELLRRITVGEPVPFARRGTPPMPAVERVLRRALSADPSRRWPAMAAFATALGAAVSDGVVRPASRAVAPAAGDPADARHTWKALRVSSAHYAAPLRSRAAASLSLGATGVAYACYRRACVTGDREALGLADAWITKVESATAQRSPWHEAADTGAFGTTSPYHTESGMHAVRALIAGAQGDRERMQQAILRFVEASRRPAARDDLYLGRAGTLVGCSLLIEALPRRTGPAADALRTLAGTTMRRLAPVIRSARRERGAAADSGVAHGLGGLVFAALRWCEASGGPVPGDVVPALARIDARAEAIGRGIFWPSTTVAPDGSATTGYLASWCNGSAGLLHLWILAHRLMQRSSLLARGEQIAWGVWEDPRRDGDACCGLSGRAWALLSWYRHTGEATWLERARVLAGRGSASWRQRPTGDHRLSLFKGAVGPALLADEIAQPERSCMPFFEHEGWPAPG